MPNWEDINLQKRRQEERDKLKVSAGTSVQRITADALPRSNSLSDHKPLNTPPETASGDPSALVSNGSPAGSPLESAPKTAQKRSRQLLKIRLEHADNVMNIVENWRLERQAAPKVVAAIQLLAAIEAGNTDYVRENYPMLVEALQKGKKRKATLSLKESDSYIERESEKRENIEPAVEQIAEAIQTITGRDRHLNRDVYELAFDLHKANYTPADLETWNTRCWPNDWRAVKAAQERRTEQPALKIIRECIGQVRSLPPDEPEPVEDDWNPFTPAEPAAPWPPQGCTVPEHVRAGWETVKSQLQIHLNRATYDTWLRSIDPVHFAGDLRAGGTLYVAVPHRYGKEWIDRHLLTALNKMFDNLLNYDGQAKRRISEDRLFSVEIVIEGDPIPMGIPKARMR